MESNNLFKDVVVFKEKGYGTNIIDHSIRCEYDMTVSQYCVVDIIAQRKNKKKTTSVLDITTFLGVNGNTVQSMLDKLEKHNLVLNQDGNYYLNKRLSDAINKTIDYSDEFEDFWTIKIKDEKKKDKTINAWPGPKPLTLQKYTKARKNKRSHKFIMDQRYWYFKILEIETFRKKMIATRFLNIDTGELDQDWKGQYEIFSKKNGKTIEKVSAVTMDDFNKEFQSV